MLRGSKKVPQHKYVIDYAERIQEVSDLLAGEFGINDPQLVELLLASRIEAGIKYPWMILETEYFSLDTTGAWFNFGKAPALLLSEFRVRRPRLGNEALDELLREKGPRLLIEPLYEKPVETYFRLWLWPYLLQDCLRVRLPYPKRRLTEPTAVQRLERAVDKALDNTFRTVTCRMPAHLPGPLLYYAELVQRLSGYLRDWDALLANLCSLAGRRAYLFNRDAPDESDWDAITRVMKDTVPHWTGKIIEEIDEKSRWSSLKGIYPENALAREVKRLLDASLIKSWHSQWNLIDRDGQGRDIVALISGEMVLR